MEYVIPSTCAPLGTGRLGGRQKGAKARACARTRAAQAVSAARHEAGPRSQARHRRGMLSPARVLPRLKSPHLDGGASHHSRCHQRMLLAARSHRPRRRVRAPPLAGCESLDPGRVAYVLHTPPTLARLAHTPTSRTASVLWCPRPVCLDQA
eukprot:scaffold7714_cov25-Tisochrysis_lutea.AAC.4